MKFLRTFFAAVTTLLLLIPSPAYAALDTARSSDISVSKVNVSYGLNDPATFSVSIAARANTSYGPFADKIHGVYVSCGSVWAVSLPWTVGKLSNLVSVYNFGKYSHQQSIKRLDSTNGEFVQLAPISLSLDSTALAEATQNCTLTTRIDYATNWNQNTFTISRGEAQVIGTQAFKLQSLGIPVSKSLEIRPRSNQPDFLEGFFETPLAGLAVRYKWYEGGIALTQFLTYNGFQAGSYEGKTLRLEVELSKKMYETTNLFADFRVPYSSAPTSPALPTEPAQPTQPSPTPTAKPKPLPMPTSSPTPSAGFPLNQPLSFVFAKQMAQVTGRKATNLSVRITWAHRIQYSGTIPAYAFNVHYKKVTSPTYIKIASNLKKTTTSVSLKNVKSGTYTFRIEAVTTDGKIFETIFTSRVK